MVVSITASTAKICDRVFSLVKYGCKTCKTANWNQIGKTELLSFVSVSASVVLILKRVENNVEKEEFEPK
jgi:hypothetical protein